MIFPLPSHGTFLVGEPCLSHCSHLLGWASWVITGIQNDSSLVTESSCFHFQFLSINPVLDQTGVHYTLLYLVTEGPPGLRQKKFCILSDKAARMIELPRDDLVSFLINCLAVEGEWRRGSPISHRNKMISQSWSSSLDFSDLHWVFSDNPFMSPFLCL